MNITFEGFVGKDTVLRTVTNGDRQDFVCDVWVAENLSARNSDNQKTLWHKVTLWRGYAEKMAQYLKKGRHVLVIADRAEAKFYTTADGVIRPYIAITNIDKIRLLDGRPQEAAPETAAEEEDPMPEGNPFED